MGDGAKSDLGNILDLFDRDNTVLIPDPVYPVYVDTNVMDGRPIVYQDATEENGFLPLPDPGRRADLIYLCSPNNPTGAAYNKSNYRPGWSTPWSRKRCSSTTRPTRPLSQSPGCPTPSLRSPGAKQCAMEFCSLSKTLVLPACAAATPSSPGSCALAGSPWENCGSGGRGASSTASAT